MVHIIDWTAFRPEDFAQTEGRLDLHRVWERQTALPAKSIWTKGVQIGVVVS